VRASLLGLVLLAACAPVHQNACSFPGTTPMLKAELYFGRGDVSDAAWQSFMADTLTANFPDGLTVLDATGQWREAATKPIEREATKLVIIAAPDTPATRDRLRLVIDAYRVRFHQQSVGLALAPVCAAF
jgi:hypothetical protein